MSTYNDSVIILSQPILCTDVLKVLADCFDEKGAIVHSDTSVIFNEFNGKEKEPETISSEEEALKSIASWPGLGGMKYSLLDFFITVYLHGEQAHIVDFITLSVSNRAYSSNASTRETFDRISAELHERLFAKRTISGFELLSPGSWVTNEVRRVRCDIFEGKYSFDLRR